MGVPGLRDYLAIAHAEAVLDVMPGGRCDHLYVDMNSLVHNAVRHSSSEAGALQSITQALQMLVTQHRPYRTLTLALDGPAPLAKLSEQRQRRLKRHGSSGGKALSSSIVTVGTPFMRDLNELLTSWAARSTWLPLVITVDPSVNAGEGELKLFSHLAAAVERSRAVLEEDSHLIVGGDADLMLLALMCPARHVVVGAPPTGRGGRPIYFSCEHFRRRLAHLAPPSPTMDGGASGQRAALDFVLLALLSGDDYLVRLRGYNLKRAVDAYCVLAQRLVVCTYHAPGPGRSASSTLSIDVRALGQLLVAIVAEDSTSRTTASSATTSTSSATATIRSASTMTDAGRCTAGDVETSSARYLEGLLWTLTMYSEARCPDYHWVPDEDGPAPTVDELAVLLSDEKACMRLDASVRCPRSSRPPPSAVEVPLLVLPAAGGQLALPQVRPLFAEGSDLTELFAQERCAECATFRARLQRLQKERESEAQAEREAREAQIAAEGGPGGGGAPSGSGRRRGRKRSRADRAVATEEAADTGVAPELFGLPRVQLEVPWCEVTSSQETVALEEDEAVPSQAEAPASQEEAPASQEEAPASQEEAPVSQEETGGRQGSAMLGPASSSPAVAESGATRDTKFPAPADADGGALDNRVAASAAAAGTAIQLELAALNAEFNAHRTRIHPPISAAARYTAVSAAVRRAVGEDLSRLSPAEYACCAPRGPSVFDHRRRS